MISSVLNESLYTWGAFLIFGFPLLVIVVSEIIDRLRRRKSLFGAPLRRVRTLVLPIVALEILARRVLDADGSSLLMRTLDTALLTSILLASLSLLHAVLSSDPSNARVLSKIPTVLLQFVRLGLILLVSGVVLSKVWEVDLEGVLTALGVGSVVLALALQDPLSNLFSGILLIFDRPFNVGDTIQSGDVEGEVVEVNWRAARLRTSQGDLVVIPNGILSTGIIYNYSRPKPLHAEVIELAFPYSDPPNRVIQAVERAILATPGVASEPGPKVTTASLGPLSIAYSAQFYVNDFNEAEDVRHAVLTRLYYAAQRDGLTMPPPQPTAVLPAAPAALAAVEAPPGKSAPAVGEKHEKLASIASLFRLDQASLAELAGSAVRRLYGQGEVVVGAGERAEGIYVIASGEAQVSALASGGGLEEVSRLTRGNLFGGMVLGKAETSLVTVTAVTDLEILLLHPGTTTRVADKNPVFAEQMEQVMEAQRRAVKHVRERGRRELSNPPGGRGA